MGYRDLLPRPGTARPPGPTASGAAVTDRVATLEGMDPPALLALWGEVLGGTPPRSLSQSFLRRVLAWELQARAQSDLPAAVRRKLEVLGGTASGRARGGGSGRKGGGVDADAVAGPGRTEAARRVTRSPRLKPGGRLLREWNGVTHVVNVVEGGFLWRGARHRSLSAIAEAITGAHWSGPRFSGLTAAAKAAKAGAASAASGSVASAGGRGRSASTTTTRLPSSRRRAA